uniref:ADP-ribose pyrophosphatase, mitochondrial n=1 Tax=Trichuris muris TaxID=70415 RepID=A0A5S6R3W0_TRIMR
MNSRVILSVYLVLFILPPLMEPSRESVKMRVPLRIRYPNTTIKRMDVPAALIDWKNYAMGYTPPSFSAPCSSSTDCDATCIGLKFNKKDGQVQRRSILGKYAVNDKNTPLNPNGRTGLSGRGWLPRYGPNHLVVLVLKRKSYCDQYAVMDKGSSYELDMFPSDFVNDPYEEVVPAKLLNMMINGLKEFSEKSKQEIISRAINKRKLLYWGVASDNRNTDNAWVEKIVYELSDDSLKLLGLMDLSKEEDFKVRWKCMSKVTVGRNVKIVKNRNYPTKVERMHSHFVRLRNTVHSKVEEHFSSDMPMDTSS